MTRRTHLTLSSDFNTSIFERLSRRSLAWKCVPLSSRGTRDSGRRRGPEVFCWVIDRNDIVSYKAFSTDFSFLNPLENGNGLLALRP